MEHIIERAGDGVAHLVSYSPGVRKLSGPAGGEGLLLMSRKLSLGATWLAPLMIDTAYTVWGTISRTYKPLTTITYAQLHVNRRSRIVNCWVLWKTEMTQGIFCSCISVVC